MSSAFTTELVLYMAVHLATPCFIRGHKQWLKLGSCFENGDDGGRGRKGLQFRGLDRSARARCWLLVVATVRATISLQ